MSGPPHQPFYRYFTINFSSHRLLQVASVHSDCAEGLLHVFAANFPTGPRFRDFPFSVNDASCDGQEAAARTLALIFTFLSTVILYEALAVHLPSALECPGLCWKCKYREDFIARLVQSFIWLQYSSCISSNLVQTVTGRQ